MRSRPAVCLAALVAAALAFVPLTVAAGSAPCVATGVLATLAPGPTPVGPSLSAADRESTTADAVSDPATGLEVGHAALGVAGCVTAGAPGGTAAQVDTWSVLGAVSGSSLEADLVPAPAGSGWHLRASVRGLQVNGAPAELTPGQSITVGNWGVLEPQAGGDAGAGQPLRWWKAALELRLTRAHGGLPPGAALLIGWVSASKPPARSPAPVPVPKPPPPPTTSPTTTSVPTTPAATPKVAAKKPKPVIAATPKRKAKQVRHKRPAHPRPKPKPKPKPGQQPLRATPPLGPGQYDFPVTGNVTWGDTYGAARSDVPGGWHHGDDLFAPLGTPVVAVADGTVFSVGWNHVGGWRLWLRTDAGDSFYYAHLSGYTALGRNNNHVHRGQVLGFVGNTGDAITTWPHLHFEVHPNELLYLGYNGAVDPTTYLDGWHHVLSLKAPPPVSLPSDAGRGEGAVVDWRRLLAVRPLRRPPATADPKAPPARPTAAKRLADAPARAGSGGSGDGWGAVVAALVLVTIAAAAVALSVRNGRSS
jgi:hypothetical protein